MDYSQSYSLVFSGLGRVLHTCVYVIRYFYEAIFVDNPLLLLFVLIPLVGLGIGLIRRIIN